MTDYINAKRARRGESSRERDLSLQVERLESRGLEVEAVAASVVDESSRGRLGNGELGLRSVLSEEVLCGAQTENGLFGGVVLWDRRASVRAVVLLLLLNRYTRTHTFTYTFSLINASHSLSRSRSLSKKYIKDYFFKN